MKKVNGMGRLAKLKLNKETVSVLTSDMLRNVAGGMPPELPSEGVSLCLKKCNTSAICG